MFTALLVVGRCCQWSWHKVVSGMLMAGRDSGRMWWWQAGMVAECCGGGGGRLGWWQRWWQDRRDLKEPVPTYKETCLRVSSFILFTAFLSLSLSFLPSFPSFFCLFLLFSVLSPFTFSFFFVCLL